MNCVGGTESLALAGINSRVTNKVMRIAELAQLCCKASASRRLLGTLVPSSEQPRPFCDCWNAAGSRSDAVRAEQSPQSSQCPDASHVFMMIHAQLLHQASCPWPFSSHFYPGT